MGSYQKRGKRSFLLVVENGYDAKGKRKKKTKTIQVPAKLLKTTKKLEDYLNLELAKFQMEVDAGEYLNPEKLRFADYVSDWLKKHANRHLEGKTIRNYTEKLNNYILPRFGHRKLSDIKPKHIVDFLYDVSLPGAAASGRKEALGDSTIYEIDKTFRVVLNKAVEWQLIKESPMDGLSRPKMKKKKMNYYEDEEVVQFMKVMYEKVDIVWRMYFITAAISGMRRGEVIALQWPDLHFDEWYIELSRSIPYFEDGKPHVKLTKTDEDKRIIPMPGWYMEEMQSFKKWWETEKELTGEEWMNEYDQYIFHSGKGKPYIPETATVTWGKIKKKHKLKNIRLHDLRHTMISFLLNEGESLLNVQERAGHSSSKITTDTYGHVTKKASKATAERFNKFDPRQFVNSSSTSGEYQESTTTKKADTPVLTEYIKTGSE